MKVTSTNQTLILAGERTPGRRRSDSRLATITPVFRQAAVPDDVPTATGTSNAVVIDEVPPAFAAGGFAQTRTFSLKPTEQYSLVQHILESGPNYTRVDVYA